MSATRLIIGLGNPGQQYAGTRHNAGFEVADRLAARNGVEFRCHSRIPALVADWKAQRLHWIVLKPVTFMNLSGQAVVAAMNFWKMELASLLVVADDVELPRGALRLRAAGGDGGHNGLKSVIERLGSKAFMRLRVGIGRPPAVPPVDLADWVLHSFANSELPEMKESFTRCVSAVEAWAVEGASVAMNRFNAKELGIGN